MQPLHWRDLGRVVPGSTGVHPQLMSGEKAGSPSHTVHCSWERGGCALLQPHAVEEQVPAEGLLVPSVGATGQL